MQTRVVENAQASVETVRTFRVGSIPSYPDTSAGASLGQTGRKKGTQLKAPEARKVDIRLHGRGNSNPHSAKPVHESHLDDQVDSDQ